MAFTSDFFRPLSLPATSMVMAAKVANSVFSLTRSCQKTLAPKQRQCLGNQLLCSDVETSIERAFAAA